jgi:hypothetical protein
VAATPRVAPAAIAAIASVITARCSSLRCTARYLFGRRGRRWECTVTRGLPAAVGRHAEGSNARSVLTLTQCDQKRQVGGPDRGPGHTLSLSRTPH